MKVTLFKARDGVYDLFVDCEWKMSTKNEEKIFEYLSNFESDIVIFSYFDMNRNE